MHGMKVFGTSLNFKSASNFMKGNNNNHIVPINCLVRVCYLFWGSSPRLIFQLDSGRWTSDVTFFYS